ncbi:MAG: hypothetical protein AB1492_06730 [Bacillota bacterium]
MATSSVGKTLLVPTPYAVKLAFLDAAFRAGLAEADCAHLVTALAQVEVRLSPPAAAVVTNTFVKVRQENRDKDTVLAQPYGPNIAYRELVYLAGRWRWAFDLRAASTELKETLRQLAPHVAYIGKRGCFVQYVGACWVAEPGGEFTQPVQNHSPWEVPERSHVAFLDDFGPEASLAVLSSYTTASVKRDRHRQFVPTIVPLGQANTGPGFMLYSRGV